MRRPLKSCPSDLFLKQKSFLPKLPDSIQGSSGTAFGLWWDSVSSELEAVHEHFHAAPQCCTDSKAAAAFVSVSNPKSCSIWTVWVQKWLILGLWHLFPHLSRCSWHTMAPDGPREEVHLYCCSNAYEHCAYPEPRTQNVSTYSV